MKKYIIIALFIILILPFVNSQPINEIQDSITKQIGENQARVQIEPGMTVGEYIQQNERIRTLFFKYVFYAFLISLFFMIDTILKGFAMLDASKRKSKKWFWTLLLITSLGILPLIYLIFFKTGQKNIENNKELEKEIPKQKEKKKKKKTQEKL
jgi:hypothetical protein